MGTYPTAKIIADSISHGDRLTTMEVVIHRFVLSEFNTHRVFSRNSASSRAIPALRQIRRVTEDPADPIVWPQEQKGMQGGEEFAPGSFDRWAVQETWSKARLNATDTAQVLLNRGLHKSVTNRLLEPFMWHTVVVTSTAWENFFRLRCNPMAQPEIRVAAEAMKAAYDASTPDLLVEGEWHLPYVKSWEFGEHDIETLKKASSARCARVSYLTQDGVRDIDLDVSLHDRLTSADPMHASPLEHVATPAPENAHIVYPGAGRSKSKHVRAVRLPRYGNLIGWHQHRFDVEAERGYSAYA